MFHNVSAGFGPQKLATLAAYTLRKNLLEWLEIHNANLAIEKQEREQRATAKVCIVLSRSHHTCLAFCIGWDLKREASCFYSPQYCSSSVLSKQPDKEDSEIRVDKLWKESLKFCQYHSMQLDNEDGKVCAGSLK